MKISFKTQNWVKMAEFIIWFFPSHRVSRFATPSPNIESSRSFLLAIHTHQVHCNDRKIKFSSSLSKPSITVRFDTLSFSGEVSSIIEAEKNDESHPCLARTKNLFKARRWNNFEHSTLITVRISKVNSNISMSRNEHFLFLIAIHSRNRSVNKPSRHCPFLSSFLVRPTAMPLSQAFMLYLHPLSPPVPSLPITTRAMEKNVLSTYLRFARGNYWQAVAVATHWGCAGLGRWGSGRECRRGRSNEVEKSVERNGEGQGGSALKGKTNELTISRMMGPERSCFSNSNCIFAMGCALKRGTK